MGDLSPDGPPPKVTGTLVGTARLDPGTRAAAHIYLACASDPDDVATVDVTVVGRPRHRPRGNGSPARSRSPGPTMDPCDCAHPRPWQRPRPRHR
ncbi:hypothetical protein ACFC8N_03570 [Streptomyces sp. NPDC055966]|uniref:hypothetical protein n=1 Tax=Streptomyces sp. NPDC055966 TaxID=3345669 RepID=UPI0035E1DF4C